MKKCIVIAMLLFAAVAFADVPQLLNVQGMLADSNGDPIPDGTYPVQFAIYTVPNGGVPLWSSMRIVPTTNGLFTVILGESVTLPYSLFDNTTLYLGIKLDYEPEMTPRQRLTSVPYAITAQKSNSLSTNESGWVDAGSIVHLETSSDKVGIGISDPSEPLVVGKDLGSINGNWIVVGDDTPGKYAGLRVGESPSNNGWIKWIVDDGEISIGTKNSGSSNDWVFRIKSFGVAIGTHPTNSAGLTINRTFWTSAPFNTYGINVEEIQGGTAGVYGMRCEGHRITTSSTSKKTYGVYGSGIVDYSSSGSEAVGVSGYASGGSFDYAIMGTVDGHWEDHDYAAYLVGDMLIYGEILYGVGMYTIDHPLDPENKLLSHSMVGSPDMKNIYDGNVITGADGRAVVTLPDYFEALNSDYRYQLTVIGSFARAIVEQEIRNNQFVIATDEPNVKVSWQVTGIRKDPLAQSRRTETIREKSASERGLYRYAEAYGLSSDRSVNHKLREEIRENNQNSENRR